MIQLTHGDAIGFLILTPLLLSVSAWIIFMGAVARIRAMFWLGVILLAGSSLFALDSVIYFLHH